MVQRTDLYEQVTQRAELTIDTTSTWSLGDLRQSCPRSWLCHKLLERDDCRLMR